VALCQLRETLLPPRNSARTRALKTRNKKQETRNPASLSLPSPARKYFPVASSQQLAQLDRLERQVTTLVAAYQQLREELSDANTTIEQLRADGRERQKQLREYQNQQNIVKLVQTIAGGEPTQANELKQRLNEYIRELDKCLAYLRD